MSFKLVKHTTGLPEPVWPPPPDRAAAPGIPREPQDAALDPAKLSGFLRRLLARRKGTIAVVAGVVLAATLVQVLTMTPVYRATAKIEIQPDSGRVLPYKELSDAAEDFLTTETYVQTQKEVLRSRALAARVVERLGLAEDARFTAPRRRGVLIDVPLGAIRQVKRWLLPEEPAAGDRSFALADRLIEDLDVRVVVNTRLLEIGYTSASPELSATLLNALVEELAELEFATRFEATAKARKFLERQLVELRESVEQSEGLLKEYAKRRDIISLDGRQQIAIDKLVGLQQEATRLETQMIAEAALIEELKNADIEAPTGLTNESILQLQERLSSLNEELASLSTRFGADWPQTRMVQRQLAEVTQQLEAERRKALREAAERNQALRQQHAMLRDRLQRHRLDASKLDQDLVQYDTLKQAAETNRGLYDSVLQRLKELSVSTGLRSSNVRILDRASPPGEVDHPSKPHFLGVALILGLALGLGAALLAESLDQSVRTAEDFERASGLPCLGVIPVIDSPRPALSGNGASAERPRESGVWEAYRSLRTAIVFAPQSRPSRSIAVTSPLAGEGRTLTVVNLGVAMAELGARVLLVDADLRNPGLAAALGLDPQSPGISAYLSNELGPDISTYVRETDRPNLSVLPAGQAPLNPSELICSFRMFRGLDILKESYDVVLVDTPAVLAYADAAVLSSMVDQVIQVARGGRTPQRAIALAKSRLAGVRARILGGVINAADREAADLAYRDDGRHRPLRERQRRGA